MYRYIQAYNYASSNQTREYDDAAAYIYNQVVDIFNSIYWNNKLSRRVNFGVDRRVGIVGIQFDNWYMMDYHQFYQAIKDAFADLDEFSDDLIKITSVVNGKRPNGDASSVVTAFFTLDYISQLADELKIT